MAATAAIAPRDKYFLRSLHQEIGLFDRKLAHLLKYETFATEALRAAAAKKISVKRDSLAATARQLAADGVEFQPAELPPSLRPEDFVLPVAAVAEVEVEEVPASQPSIGGREQTSYDLGKEIREYLANRKKA